MENAKITLATTVNDIAEDSAEGEDAMDASFDLMQDGDKPFPPLTVYLPENGTNDYSKWTINQVSQWASNFLPESAQLLHEVQADGLWLTNFYNGKLSNNPLSPFERNVLFDHLELVANRFLLLKPDGRGVLNTVCNLLFSCWDFRVMFDDYGFKDLENGKRKTMLYISEIFLKKTDNSRRLRNVLEKDGVIVDVRKMFDAFLKNLQHDFTLCPQNTPTTLTFIEHLYYIQKDCETCHTTWYQEEKGEVMKTKHSSTIEIKNGSFKDSVKQRYPRELSSRRCKWCKGRIWKSLKTERTGQHNFMKVVGGRIEDLDFDAKVEFFGTKWMIIALAEKKKIGKEETYVSWIRAGDGWIRVVNDTVEDRHGEQLKDLDIKILVFKEHK